MYSRSVVRTGFHPVSIVVMVIGFMIAWPLGLLVLAYILWGERLGWRERLQSFGAGVRDGIARSTFARDTFRNGGASHRGRSGFGFGSSTGNSAFDAYRAREMERLEAERRRLEDERRDFEAYMRDLRRARDQDEFDRFKAERARRRGGSTI